MENMMRRHSTIKTERWENRNNERHVPVEKKKRQKEK
jgi:hypothetical protein